MEQITIQVRFTIEEDGVTFQDALNLTQEEFDALSEEELDTMKQDRFKKWKTFKDTPAPEPSKVDLQSELAEKEREILELKELILHKD